jgi:Bacterial protein of unknown function (DUF885)
MVQANREENLGASISRSVQMIASDYFNSIGHCLPYQCASDEFYFLPRSARALDGLGFLDTLDPASVKGLVEHARNLGKELEAAYPTNLEEEIDRLTLRKSIERFIWYFDRARVWRRDPTLYIKIPLFAIDEALSRDFQTLDELRRGLAGILLQITGFLRQGIDNLERPSALSASVASEMARDAVSFFRDDVVLFIEEKLEADAHILKSVHGAIDGWQSYQKSLQDLTTEPSFYEGERAMAELFVTGVDYPKSPSEILEMAEKGYSSTLDKILTLAKQIDPLTPWQKLVEYQDAAAESSRGVLEIYQKEVQSLRAFFSTHDVLSFPSGEQVEVFPTPSYLSSLRATASYRAPLTGQYGRSGVFYITPGAELRGLILSHRSYLSAHETYPGHHVLDTIRLHHANPIRRQIESPLFYEGWASYAETLLDELGYTTDAKQRLVQLQRQLWRDLRAVLDIRLQTGRITMAQAAREIEAIGFPPHSAARQVRRFALTPGYQSCYFLGMHEILRVREKFADRLGLKAFHDLLLGGGQLSFELVEKRIEAATTNKQDKLF